MTTLLQVREDGTISVPAAALGNPDPHTSYVAESNGAELVLRRAMDVRRQSSSEEWVKWRTRLADIAKRIGDASITDESAVDILSKMRR